MVVSMGSSFSDDNQVSRREAVRTLGGLGLGALLGGLGSSAQGAPPDERPNIIFIMTDDHAAQALSCYGSNRNETPHLDRLAREGMRFENSFVTNSLCAPTRGTMLTGKYSHKHGITENNAGAFDSSQQTFPKLLREAGYTTALVGKWHLGSDPTSFDYWNRLPGQGSYFNPRFIQGDIDGRTGDEQYNGYVTDIITDLAIDRIEGYREQDEPFCLFKWHKAPHRAWLPDAEHDDLYDDRDVPEPETFYDDYADRASAAAHAAMRIPDHFRYPEGGNFDHYSERERKQLAYQQYIKDYLGTVASLDDNIGRLLDYLDEAGLAENTIVVYTSDNGFFLGEHGWFDKRFMYEESLRIPLLVRYPGVVPAGTVEDRIALDIDMATTFLDYAGVEMPGDMQGCSLRPLLEGEQAPNWRDAMYYHYYEYPGPHRVRPHVGVRDERYKLIYYYTIDEWELFDLETDPHEMHNAYGDPAYTDVRRQMKKELERLRQQYDDQNAPAIRTDVDAPPTAPALTVHPNHPDPFTRSTRFEVEVPAPTHIRVTVYDLLGRRIRTLADRRITAAGSVSFSWDGTNEAGHGTPSGTYLVRVQTDDAATTLRVTRTR